MSPTVMHHSMNMAQTTTKIFDLGFDSFFLIAALLGAAMFIYYMLGSDRHTRSKR